MIIWIASYPRSGNSLYREILWQTCGIRAYSIYPNNTQIDEVTGYVRIDPKDIEKYSEGDEINFIKTHEIRKDDYPTIYIVRDGRDTLVSETHFTFDYGGDRFGYKDWNGVLTELCQRGKWNYHVMWYLIERQRLCPFVYVRYEDLVNDPIGTFLWSLDAINIPVLQTSKTMIAFDELHDKWPKFFLLRS